MLIFLSRYANIITEQSKRNNKTQMTIIMFIGGDIMKEKNYCSGDGKVDVTDLSKVFAHVRDLNFF